MRVLYLFIISLLFVSCGYKPSAKFARNIVGEKISTSVIISAKDPQNTVIIKDAVDRAIIEVFQSSLVDKKDSQTHLQLSMGNPSYSPIQYDTNGYIVAYRASITLNIKRVSKDIAKNYTAKGSYDFSIKPNAIVTDQQRFEAILGSSKKAIKSFIAKVSAEGSRKH
jgi:hypothetical protein